MNQYHKIQSVFKRDPATNHKTFLMGEYSMPEFAYLAENQWVWSEKIDGTNIRVIHNPEAAIESDQLQFRGKSDNAQMPGPLVAKLQSMFARNRMAELFSDGHPMTLYGEGYGAGIQKGGGYIPNGVSFILFDIYAGKPGEGMWLNREAVEEIAAGLNIDVTPIIGRGTIAEAIELVRAGFTSTISNDPTLQSEGLVLRPTTELRTRRGDRIITKIKHRDFQMESKQPV